MPLASIPFPVAHLHGFFNLNVCRQAAARNHLKLFRDNGIDAALMPPTPHTAMPLDKLTMATYTDLWSCLDYPAIVIPVGTMCESDVVDDPSNAKYGPEDAHV